jgi:hypothetical protein
MHNYTLFVVAALLLPLCLYGCAIRPKGILTQETPADVDRVLASLRQRENDLKTFKGVGRFKTIRGNGTKIFRVVWIGSKPENLRVETLGPWGQPNLTFVVNGPSFFLHSRQDNHYFRGDATADNLARLVSIPVKGEDLFRLLSGQPPILPFHHGKIRTSPADSGSILSLYKKWGRLIEKIWMKDAGKSVEKVEVFDAWGNLRYRIAFSEFHQTESFWFPHTIAISDPEGPVCSLMVERFWTNVPIPEGAYTMEISGAGVTDLDS